MKYWIFPSNLDKFDSIEHFKKDKQVRWRQVKQSQSAEIDDIVFVYITKNDGKYSQTLAVQARIVDINKTEYPILLEQIEFFQTPIPLKVLQEIGIVKYDKDNIQSPRFITKEQADKIFEFASTSNSIDNEQEMPNHNTQNKTAKNPSLNQILYGPPGTGKTYNTINKALEILGVETQGKSRAELKAQFDEFRQNGQIEFVTFHQSFSYEEFVEGIKPNTDNPENMVYEVQDGIFKKICEKALIDDNKKINILRKNIEIYRNGMIKTIKQTQQPLNYQGVEFKITDEAKDILADNLAFVIQVGNLKQILDKMQNFENIDKIIEEVLSNYVDDKLKLLDYVKRYKAFI